MGDGARSAADALPPNAATGASLLGARSLPPPTSPLSILLNVPNTIGWVRAALLVTAMVTHQQALAHGQAPYTTLCLLLASLALDFFDGWAARHFRQTTTFGAVLDVLLDNLTRGWLWAAALPPSLAALPLVLEMTVFAFTHKVSGGEWKTAFFVSAPSWVRSVSANGFKSPAGVVAICGLMGAPLWAWCCRYLPGSLFAHPCLGAVLVPARLLSAAVECWVILRYLSLVVQQDLEGAAAAAAGAPSPRA